MAAANLTRAGKAHRSKAKLRRKPDDPADVLLGKVRAKVPPITGALREICTKLEIAMAVVRISAATLRAQNAEYDSDVALCLRNLAGKWE